VATADARPRFSGKERERAQGKRRQSYTCTETQSEATEFQIHNSRFQTLHFERISDS
jgi:hypothetical protein